MSFQLLSKETKKYKKYEGYSGSIYGSETKPPGRTEILGYSNGTTSLTLFSIIQHENYSMGIQYASDYQEYGDCIKDKELPGKCYYEKERVNDRISFLLYEKNGNDYNQIFSSSPISLGSISQVSDASITSFYVDEKKNVIAGIISPGETINLKKFNKKGRLLWANNEIPDISKNPRYNVGFHDLITDKSGDIYALYTSYVASPHSRYGNTSEDLSLTKFNGKNGNMIWTTSAFKDYHYEKSDLSSYRYEEKLHSGANSLLLVDEGSLLLWGSSYFPDDFTGTRVFQVGLESGDIIDSSDIDSAFSYGNSELFTDGKTAYLRTTLGAYDLGELAFSKSQVKDQGAMSLDSNLNAINIGMPSKFKIKAIDKITNFDSEIDTLEIDKDGFGVDSAATFAAGKNKKAIKKLAKQDFDFLYDQRKGGLYFNENGADKGFGDGGIIAILKGAPDLNSDNLEFV